jgi:hypothetical protein
MSEAKPTAVVQPYWIVVEDFTFPAGWTNSGLRDARARAYCERLEAGGILFFQDLPFQFPAEDRDFLLAQRWSELRLHKNVSYRPVGDVLRGFSGHAENTRRLHAILRNYSARVIEFLGNFLSPYAGKWILDFASFRPLKEEGRDLPLHKRNDLLHVDAFPSRPTRGGRILRVFTNLNPGQPRVWQTTNGFEWLAQRYAKAAGLDRAAASGSGFGRIVQTVGRVFGIKQFRRTAYDRFMLRFHDYLKENSDFQANCPKIRLEFPPLSTWLVLTDGVAHAALSGQYALEQTLLIPRDALVASQHAPYRILEQIASRSLIS